MHNVHNVHYTRTTGVGFVTLKANRMYHYHLHHHQYQLCHRHHILLLVLQSTSMTIMMTNIDASIITIIKPPHRSAKCERSDEASTRKILTTLFRATGIDLTTAAQCLHGMRAIFSPDLESAPASPGCEEATIAVTCQWQLSNLPPIQYFLSWLRHLKLYTSSHQSEFHLVS